MLNLIKLLNEKNINYEINQKNGNEVLEVNLNDKIKEFTYGTPKKDYLDLLSIIWYFWIFKIVF